MYDIVPLVVQPLVGRLTKYHCSAFRHAPLLSNPCDTLNKQQDPKVSIDSKEVPGGTLIGYGDSDYYKREARLQRG